MSNELLRKLRDSLRQHITKFQLSAPEDLELIAEADEELLRHEWVKVVDALPVLREGEYSIGIWLAHPNGVIPGRHYRGDNAWWKSETNVYTHWRYRYIEPSPRPPQQIQCKPLYKGVLR